MARIGGKFDDNCFRRVVLSSSWMYPTFSAVIAISGAQRSSMELDPFVIGNDHYCVSHSLSRVSKKALLSFFLALISSDFFPCSAFRLGHYNGFFSSPTDSARLVSTRAEPSSVASDSSVRDSTPFRDFRW